MLRKMAVWRHETSQYRGDPSLDTRRTCGTEPCLLSTLSGSVPPMLIYIIMKANDDVCTYITIGGSRESKVSIFAQRQPCKHLMTCNVS